MYGYGYRSVFKNYGGIQPTEIGTIFDIQTSALANLNDFTIVKDGATSITLDSGYIKITGSPAAALFPLDNFIQYNGWTTGLENWVFSVDYIIKSYTTADQGIQIGWRNDSTVGDARSDWYTHYRNSSNAATGDGYRYFNATSTLTPNTFNTNPLTAEITPVVDHNYRMTVTRSMTTTGARFTLTIQDLTNGTSNSGSINYTYQNTSGQLDMSSSKFFIGTTGGTHWVSRITLTSTDKKNPHWLFDGDSMTAGYNATLRANHWFEMLRSAHPTKTFTKSACQGDRCSTSLSKTNEIELIAPTKVSIFKGTNDAISLGSATAISNYDALVDYYVSIGITEFIHTTPLPRGGSTAVQNLRSHIISEYGALSGHTVIDLYDEANDPGNPGHIKASYTSDNIHGNDLLWSFYFNQLSPLV